MIPITATKRQRWRGDYNPRWFVLFIDADQSGATAKDVAFTTREITGLTGRADTTVIASRLYADSIKNVGYAVDGDRVGGVAKSGKATVVIDNTDDFLGWLERNEIYVDGREVQIYHWDPAETDYTTADLFWSGFVQDTELKGDRIEVRCEDGMSRYDRLAPPNIYEDTTGGTEYQVREQIIGDAIPIVLGRVQRAIGITLSDVSDDGTYDRGMLVQFCDPLFPAVHDINAITDLVFGDEGLMMACGGFAKVKTTAVPSLSDVDLFTLDAAEGRAYFQEFGQDVVHLYIDIVPQSAYNHFNSGREGDYPLRAVDGSESTSASIVHNELGEATRIYGLRYQIPRIGLTGTIERSGSATGIFVLQKIYLSLNDGLDCGYFFYIDSPANALEGSNLGDDEPAKWYTFGDVTGEFDYYSPPDPDADVQLSITGTTEWQTSFEQLTVLSRNAVNFGVTGTQLASIATALIREFMVRVYFTLLWPDSGWYADVSGLEDDSSGTFTGTASALIENPAHLAAFMAAKLSNATASKVDVTGFKAIAASSRAGWIFAKQLVDRRSVLDYLAELGEQALLWFWLDRNNKVRGFPMTLPAAGELVTTIDKGDVKGEFKKVARASAREVATNFVFKYAWNPVGDSFDKAITCTPDASSAVLGATYEAMCADARDRWCGGLERDAEEIELSWVEDDATALEIAKKVIRRRTTRPWEIEYLGDIASFVHEPGDPVKLNIDHWLDLLPIGAVEATYRITSVQSDQGKVDVTIKAVEVLE